MYLEIDGSAKSEKHVMRKRIELTTLPVSLDDVSGCCCQKMTPIKSDTNSAANVRTYMTFVSRRLSFHVRCVSTTVCRKADTRVAVSSCCIASSPPPNRELALGVAGSAAPLPRSELTISACLLECSNWLASVMWKAR